MGQRISMFITATAMGFAGAVCQASMRRLLTRLPSLIG